MTTASSPKSHAGAYAGHVAAEEIARVALAVNDDYRALARSVHHLVRMGQGFVDAVTGHELHRCDRPGDVFLAKWAYG